MLNDGNNLGAVGVSLDGGFLLVVLFGGSDRLFADFRRNGFGLSFDYFLLRLGFGLGLGLGFRLDRKSVV